LRPRAPLIRMENFSKAARAVSRAFRGNTQTVPPAVHAEVVPPEPPRKKSVLAQCCEGLRSRKRTEDPFQHLTLEAIRADQDLYKRFRRFAQEEQSLENLNFLDICTQFARRHDVLAQIFTEHVHSQRTNISGQTRRALIQQWESTQDFDDPRWPVLLGAANDEVARLVRDNTLARFKEWLSSGAEAPRGPVSVAGSGPRRLSQFSQEQIDQWERRQSEVARRASTASNASDVSASLLVEQNSPCEHVVGPSDN